MKYWTITPNDINAVLLSFQLSPMPSQAKEACETLATPVVNTVGRATLPQVGFDKWNALYAKWLKA